MSKRNHTSVNGFTMLEVIIAMVLLATVATGLLTAFLFAVKIAGSGSEQAAYFRLARERGEALLEASNGQWWNGTAYPLSPTPDSPASPPTTPYDTVLYNGKYYYFDGLHPISASVNLKSLYRVEDLAGRYRKVTMLVTDCGGSCT